MPPARPEDVFSVRALWCAAQRALRGKRRRASVARFALDLEPRLLALSAALQSGTWPPHASTPMAVRDPKPRTIHVPWVSDRVVHQAVGAVLEPRFERRLIRDTYASRPGLGTHAALRRARAWARTYPYYAHLDVARYFPSIDHAVLLAELERDVPEPWLRELLAVLLDAHWRPGTQYFPGDDLFEPLRRRVGLPLGTYVSQLLANRFLDPVDHLAKDRLCVRGYLRYMDDMLVFGRARAEVAEVALALEERAWSLRLRLHPYEVRPTRGGVGIVGYRVLPDHVRVRRTTVARAERRLARQVEEVRSGRAEPEALWASLRATFAHWSHADTGRLKERLLQRLQLNRPDDC